MPSLFRFLTAVAIIFGVVYGAIFALFASVIAVSVFLAWRSLRWLARLIGLADE